MKKELRPIVQNVKLIINRLSGKLKEESEKEKEMEKQLLEEQSIIKMKSLTKKQIISSDSTKKRKSIQSNEILS